MRDRRYSCNYIMLVFVLSILACGCAGKAVVSPVVPPEKSLEILCPVIQEADRIFATADIDLITAQGHYPVRAALIIQKPSFLRLEILPVVGTPDFILTATPDNMQIFIPSRGEFYSGKPSAENLARFLPWGLNIDDIVMILSCDCPASVGKNSSFAGYQEGDLTRVDMKAASGLSQTLWLGHNGRMVKLIRHGADGRENFQVRYEDYASERLPAGRITVTLADNVTIVSVKYSDLKIVKETNWSIFELPIPAGMQKINLDR
ncbi:MAG: hypothetical protein ACYDGO_02675 [Smithellaceae bacterium]